MADSEASWRAPPDLLRGDVAIVTGAAQGNGVAIAAGLAGAGARVAICDIQAGRLAATAEALRKKGASVHVATVDVSDAAACRAFAAAAREALGPVSILVNNAGVIHRDRVDAPEFAANWDRTFRINVDGARNMTLAALGDLRATRGRVVNLGSILSLRGAASAVSYAATKGAIAQFTRALAAELAPDGVRVNALAPGVIATPMTVPTRESPEALARFMAHTPMGRVGEPEELVGPVLFLVSPMSSYVTGVVLPVDGGYVAI
jgi:NAD(P)-dependent dehydrogenase (short-subunit alcohol dehydrogenase family)